MKKVLTTALILLTCLSAQAQTVTSADVKTQVAKILENSYRTIIPNAEVEVKISATPFANLVLPDGQVTYKIVQGGDKIIPRDIKRVDIYVNNAFVKTLNLPAQTSVYKDVLVASDFINRDQAITNETAMVKKMDVSQRMDYVLSEKMFAKEMKDKKAFQK